LICTKAYISAIVKSSTFGQEAVKVFIKRLGESHFTKKFKDKGMRSWSDQIILPGRDPARVKLTHLWGARGEKLNNISNNVDETACITEGLVMILWNDIVLELCAGGSYYIPAGETYSITFVRDTEAIRFFSQAADGTIPENEPSPIEEGAFPSNL
jgi:hypothetical protein